MILVERNSTWNGFSPVCNLSWTIRFALVVKTLSQYLHGKPSIVSFDDSDEFSIASTSVLKQTVQNPSIYLPAPYLRIKQRQFIKQTTGLAFFYLESGRVLRRWIFRPSVLRNFARCFLVTWRVNSRRSSNSLPHTWHSIDSFSFCSSLSRLDRLFRTEFLSVIQISDQSSHRRVLPDGRYRGSAAWEFYRNESWARAFRGM